MHRGCCKWRNRSLKKSQKAAPNLTVQNLTTIPIILMLKFKKSKGTLVSGGETTIIDVQGLAIL